MINFTRLAKSFRHAFKGMGVAVREQNIRIHIFIAFIVILLAIILQVKLIEFAVLVVIVVLVICLEIINSIFEKVIDVLKPRYHILVGSIKDLMAATVLVAGIGAIIIGILIFLPYLL